jgi:hypothetical protein
MGRPPIGKVAMTSAERTRRWVLKEHAAEIERLQVRIRELEAELTRERARKAPSAAAQAPQDATATLSKTAQQKLEAAIRQHKRTLDLQFEQRVSDEIRRRLEETVLPTLNRREAEYLKGINAHNGYIPRAKYLAMWRCLHPDSRGSVSDHKLAEAFRILADLERVLVKKEERETVSASHWTADAMMARREAVRRRNSERSRNAPSRR